MSTLRWISYTSQNIPGNQSFGLGFHYNLKAAREAFTEFCDEVGSTDCSMRLYGVPTGAGEEMADLAHEFREIGCPFDYPAWTVETGPRGGVRLSRA